tara:strand:+ start:891 stop:1682 length:792 start_codon:yes stop_codon:yes gene_type:complete
MIRRNNFIPIRSLVRGLDIILAMNKLGSSSISEISQYTKLPRGTVYRMLETLADEKFIIKNKDDNKYRLLSKVNKLSQGFINSDWIISIAKPLIEKLCKELVWPISIATFNGSEMILRETTDENSPLALKKLKGGFRVPILGSAAGLVYLAYTDQLKRDKILFNLSNDKTYKSNLLSKDLDYISKIILEIKNNGYSIYSRSDLKQSIFAVPINTKFGIIGTISLRYIDTAISKKDIEKKFLKPMTNTAIKIAKSYNSSLSEKN